MPEVRKHGSRIESWVIGIATSIAGGLVIWGLQARISAPESPLFLADNEQDTVRPVPRRSQFELNEDESPDRLQDVEMSEALGDSEEEPFVDSDQPKSVLSELVDLQIRVETPRGVTVRLVDGNGIVLSRFRNDHETDAWSIPSSQIVSLQGLRLIVNNHNEDEIANVALDRWPGSAEFVCLRETNAKRRVIQGTEFWEPGDWSVVFARDESG